MRWIGVRVPMNRFTRVIRATQVMPVSKANYQVCVCVCAYCLSPPVADSGSAPTASCLFFHALGPCSSHTLLLCGNVFLTYSHWHFRSAETHSWISSAIVCLCTFEANYCCTTIHSTCDVCVCYDRTSFAFKFIFRHDFDWWWWWWCPSKKTLSKRSFLFMHILSYCFTDLFLVL